MRPDREDAPMAEQSKIALVTGGSRGLGRSTAISLARKGIASVITYQSNRDEAEATVQQVLSLDGQAVALKLDTGDIASFEGFAETLRKTLREKWGRGDFDYLVNNAGFGLVAPIAETSEEDFDRLVNVQLKGVFFLTQRLLPVIVDGGGIVNISSGLARFSNPGMAAYAMMKGGIEVFTRYLAKELGTRGITANTIAPGPIETDFNGGAVRDNADYNSRVASLTALGRAGVPDDIGPMIASFLSDDNRWVNGQRIEVSGGINL
jgi:NAD(P)-dependent dehydrogenase (short-subunit alcohol dehydrogenase family)